MLVLFLVHLLEFMSLSNILELLFRKLGLLVRPTRLHLYFDLLRGRFLNTFLELFKLLFFLDHKLMDCIIFEAKLAKSV